MPQITIGVDSDIHQDLALASQEPPAGAWITPMPAGIGALDSGFGEIDLQNPATVTFSYRIVDGPGIIQFIVTYDNHGLYGQGAGPSSYPVEVRLQPDTIIFDVG